MHYVLTSRSWMFSKTKASVRRGGKRRADEGCLENFQFMMMHERYLQNAATHSFNKLNGRAIKDI